MHKNKQNKKILAYTSTLFLVPVVGHSRFAPYLLNVRSTWLRQCSQYPPHTTRLKTVHRTVFFTPCSLSVFESHTKHRIKKEAVFLLLFLLVPVVGHNRYAPYLLGDRSACFAVLAVPASHNKAKNSSPNCFLYALFPLSVRVPHKT